MHWADVIAADLLKRSNSHRIATGISPSGHIHLGNLREMVTADAIRRALLDAGGEAKIVYIADDFDPLRRRYPFLPEEYENYVGMPLCKIPDPEGCHDSYSEHFLQPFLESLEILGIPVEVRRAYQMYSEGLYENNTRIALKRRDEIARIIAEVTGRELEERWYPFMPLCENCGRINSTRVTSFDENWIYYECDCGHSGRVGYVGGGKLTWRVDWAARWQILSITCEPFGKDHAAAGGSYDTGVRIAREIFDYEPPYPVPYEWIHLKGKGAMKSSKGIVLPVREMVEVIPPEIVRYITIRVKPERHIEFDPGLGLLDLVEEFEEKFKEKDRSVELSLVGEVVYSDVPFRHLIVVGQIANWDLEKALEIIERTGYTVDDVTRRDVERRLKYARKWLEKYAPDNIKFEIPEKVTAEFSEEEKKFLRAYAERLRSDMKPEEIHTLVYDVSKEVGIKSSKAFQAIYKAILGKTYGPRVGYFIKSLGVEWVRERIKAAL
ncbi:MULTISPECIES: lysine--tRNA ligase [Archaeoglobus]|jgi:lysyl-tRNA synthetase class 1|uniref:Lysine--tRNA ligase n=3 Tax=Archaeoglobus fulgidus TaxID=2234 RepID=SYK_ARCFU|nr:MULTISPECIES: lysine--tRNA ligase [Archaeoglobus]O29052.1 RecName: Full=Lysine--tRNA ligase; AltName: Full=Lysyl-tRNA synthetase; Short=LysRS [Archaeoglobus fulgidus DSM 4304]AAB90029.1 lysyl-tRNA synthetase (lysS) [Archaeoglobus fulgidus DSM 4304]AIG98090.1 lysyl-tRNA synthetase, archaeal and spirochete [Archaeoglobus fulgidus DSM 8774]KUJ93662.1 MAG: Lysine--tRNA ligase [Archaeoglobus fulgidus]KUK06077.1 MAG: Lysine--tRNA ligase [Archaeoglobus fulgidus]MDI3498062.1 lysyl-tRNA synthetase,